MGVINSSEIPVREKKVTIFFNYWNKLVYCHKAVIQDLKPWLSWWEKCNTQIRPDPRQLVTKVQAHPCFPDQSRNRQVLAISFRTVSKSFFQAVPFSLQVCPSSSSGQVSYVFFSLSADTLAVSCFQDAVCKTVPMFPIFTLVIWKLLRMCGLILAPLYSTASCLGQLLRLSPYRDLIAPFV